MREYQEAGEVVDIEFIETGLLHSFFLLNSTHYPIDHIMAMS